MAGGGELRLSVITTNDSSGAKAAAADMAAAAKEVERAVQQQASAAEKAAKQQADEVEKAAERQAKAHEDMSKRITQASAVFTLGFAAAGIAAVNMAAGFEQSMDQVGAVAGASEAEIEKLGAKAKQLGADTKFGASEAAGAMEELAASGMTVNQILNGGADAAAALAAAGGTSLPTAARIAATAMSAWGLEGEDVIDVTNRLTAAANVSRFGVEDMGAAFGSVASVAASMGFGIDETSTAIAALADSANSGADAGTSFKSMILQLPGASGPAKKAIEDLGLQFFTAEGAMRSLPEIIDELNQKMNGLSQQEKLDFVTRIFGTDGGRAALDLMQMTGAEFTKMMETMGDTDAADIAAQRMSNARGSIEEFKGSVETLGISLGEKGVPALTALADAGVMAVNAFGSLPDSTQNLALGAIAIAGAAPAAAAGISKMAAAYKAMALGSAGAAGPIGLAAAATVALAAGVDLLLAKTTGHGIIERVFGDVAQADAASDALARLDGILIDTAPGAERMEAITTELGRAVHGFGANAVEAGNQVSAFGEFVGGADGRFLGFNVGLSDGVDKFKQYEERVRAAGEAMVANGATTAELHQEYLKLPPALRDAFDEATNLRNRLGELGTAAGETLTGALGSVSEKLGEGAGRMSELAAETAPAAGGMGEFAAQVEAAAGNLDDLDDVMKNINGSFADTNPAVIAAKASLALIDEAIADVTNSTEPLTEAQKEYVAALEASKAPYEAIVKGAESHQKALEGIQPHLELLMGEEGYAGLAAAMVDAGRDGDSAVNMAANAREAFGLLAAGDLPAATQAFLNLKGELTPDEWAAIGKAIGVKFPEEVKAGFLEGEIKVEEGGKALGDAAVRGVESKTGDMKTSGGKLASSGASGITDSSQEVYNAGAGLGWRASEGFAAGIDDGAWMAVQAAARLAGATMNEVAAFLSITSPSKEFMKLGRFSAEGLAEGMRAGEGMVRAAAEEMAAAGLDSANTATARGLAANAGGFSLAVRGVGRDGYGVPVGGSSGISTLAQLLQLLATFDEASLAMWMGNPENIALIDRLRNGEAGLPEGHDSGPKGGWVRTPRWGGKGYDVFWSYDYDRYPREDQGGHGTNPWFATPTDQDRAFPSEPEAPKPPEWKAPKPNPGAWGITNPSEAPPGTPPTSGNIPKGTYPGASENTMGDAEIAAAMADAGWLASLDPKVAMAIQEAYESYLAGTISRDMMYKIIGNYGWFEWSILKRNGGSSVYQDSEGNWRDVLTGELATGPDGKFLTAQYQQDAVKWISQKQSDPTKFGARGLQEPVAQPSEWQRFWASAGVNPRSMSADPHRANDFEWFTEREDWAALGYGADATWTSDPWFGFVPEEWLNTPDGWAYLAMRGLSPVTNQPGYNRWHPNVSADGTMQHVGGKGRGSWRPLERRRSSDTTPKAAFARRYGLPVATDESAEEYTEPAGVNITNHIVVQALDATGVDRVIPQIIDGIERNARRGF